MGGFDNHVAIMGDWMPPPSPSPRSFFTAMLGDDISSRSISEHVVENKTGAFFQGHEEWTDEKDGDGAGDQLTKSDPFSEQKMGSRGGGLLERMAARAGFNAPRLNTENIRPSDLSQNGDVRSPYLTIPSGLSPTTLLESPVFLSNSQVQPSPTTGKIPFGSGGYSRSSTLITDTHNKNKNFYEDINTSSFAFKPVAESSPFHFFGAASKMSSSNFPQKIFPSIEVSVQPENSRQSQSTEPSKVPSQNRSTLHLHADLSRTSGKKDASGNTVMSEPRAVDIVGGNAEHSPPLDEPQDEDADQRGGGDAVVGGALSDDGYNWRKYGQKLVKGSEYPQSYYKCTHPNCPVKKKVERSPEGHITEIIYKGTHYHSKPLPNRRSAIGSANPLTDIQLNIGDQNGAQIGPHGDSIWTTMQKGAPDWRHDNLEATSSASMGGEYSNGPNTVPGQNSTHFELGDAVDASSTFSNEEDEDDRGTHGGGDVDQRGGGDAVVGGAPSDDGYNWRKYGQKQVKGSEYPRSYYKCTHPNCPVKKKVERSLEGHITEIIYKGTHNHSKPLPNRRSAIGSANPLTDIQLNIGDQNGAQIGPDGDSIWTTMQGYNSLNPHTSLRKILETMRKNFRGLRGASIEELAEELHIEEISIQNGEKLDPVQIPQTISLPQLELSQSEVEVMQVDSSDQQLVNATNIGSNVFGTEHNNLAITCTQEKDIVRASKRKGNKSGGTVKASTRKGDKSEATVKLPDREDNKKGVKIEISLEEILQTSKMKLEDAAQSLGVSKSTLKRVCRVYLIKRWPPRKKNKVVCSQLNESAPCVDLEQSSQLNLDDLPSAQPSATFVHTEPHDTTMQDDNVVTIKAKYAEGNAIKFRLSLSSRLIELQQEVAQRLNLEAGTYCVKYKDEDGDLILIACDGDLRDYMSVSRLEGKTCIVVLLEPLVPITDHL